MANTASRKRQRAVPYLPAFDQADLAGISHREDQAFGKLLGFLRRLIQRRMPGFGPPSRWGKEYADYVTPSIDLSQEMMVYLSSRIRNGGSRLERLLSSAAGNPEHFEALLRRTLDNFLLRTWAEVNRSEDLLRRQVVDIFKKNRCFTRDNGIVRLAGAPLGHTPPGRHAGSDLIERHSRDLAALIERNARGKVTRASLVAILERLLRHAGGTLIEKSLFPALYEVIDPAPVEESLDMIVIGPEGSLVRRHNLTPDRTVPSPEAPLVADDLVKNLTRPAAAVLVATVCEGADPDRIGQVAVAAGLSRAEALAGMSGLRDSMRQSIPEDWSEMDALLVIRKAAVCLQGAGPAARGAPAWAARPEGAALM